MGENSVGVIRLDAFKFEDMVAGVRRMFRIRRERNEAREEV